MSRVPVGEPHRFETGEVPRSIDVLEDLAGLADEPPARGYGRARIGASEKRNEPVVTVMLRSLSPSDRIAADDRVR